MFEKIWITFLFLYDNPSISLFSPVAGKYWLTEMIFVTLSVSFLMFTIALLSGLGEGSISVIFFNHINLSLWARASIVHRLPMPCPQPQSMISIEPSNSSKGKFCKATRHFAICISA